MTLRRRKEGRGADARERRAGRPEPGGAPPDQEAPQPQPEPREQRLRDPGPTDLSRRDYVAIVKRAGREALDDGVTDIAAALAYYAFAAIPALLLVALGVFGLAASPAAVTTMLERVDDVAPAEAITLLDDTLSRVAENQGGGLALLSVGFLFALWTSTSAMTALVRGLNRVYDRKESRGFVRQRLAALAMLVCALVAVGLVFGLLVLGPHLSDWIGGALGLEGVFGWIWWTAQWPILVGGLLAAFGALLYLGPDVDHPRWSFLTFGSVLAVVVWLVASGAFAVYVAYFGGYNAAWGSLGAVIIMLTWLWLSALAFLLGAEVNAEAERSRELRRGEPAERELQAPAKGSASA